MINIDPQRQQRVLETLKQVAKEKSLICYSDLKAGRGDALADLLDAINQERAGSPMITALAVYKRKGLPTLPNEMGFRGSAIKLRYWDGTKSFEQFWEEQRQAVYKEFGDKK